MSKTESIAPVESLERLIYEVRGQKVMIDADLSGIYCVTTKRLNEAVKRNAERFPEDFAFQLTQQEFMDLRSQIATSKGRGGRRYRPYAFTEHGAIMAANVLNSPQAVQMSVFVVRAFLKMRVALSNNRELARKLAALERELKERLDVHEAAIVTILQRVMDIIDPPALPEPPRKDIGFHIKEARGRYATRRRRDHILQSL
jgi:ORF6N domain